MWYGQSVMVSPFVVRAVDGTNLAAALSFLERHSDTALSLLSNLALNGPCLGPALNSANFKCIEEQSQVCAVFCLTRRSIILAEAGGRVDFASAIVEACLAEPIQISGVVGERELAEAIGAVLRVRPGFVQHYASKENLQALEPIDPKRYVPMPGTRRLRPDDFAEWDALRTANFAQNGIPLPIPRTERQASFEQSVQAGRWWGYFENERLLAIAALNAVHDRIGLVGGVYTVPERRREGWSRATMHALLSDSVSLHGLTRLILSTRRGQPCGSATVRVAGIP
jgi:hypothetical protein